MYREMVKSSSHPSPYGYHLIQGYKVGKNRAHVDISTQKTLDVMESMNSSGLKQADDIM